MKFADDDQLFAAMRGKLFTAVVGDVLDTMATCTNSCRRKSALCATTWWRSAAPCRCSRPITSAVRRGPRCLFAKTLRSDVPCPRQSEAERDLCRDRGLAALRPVGELMSTRALMLKATGRCSIAIAATQQAESSI